MFVLSLQLFSCTRMEDTDLYKKLKNNEPVLIPITCHEDSSFCFLTSQKLWNKWNIKMVDQCAFDSLLYYHIKNNVYITLDMSCIVNSLMSLQDWNINWHREKREEHGRKPRR